MNGRILKLFDTHAHLNDPKFKDDVEAVVENALRSGVQHIVVPGYDLVSSELAVELAHRFEGVIFAAAGLHPHDADDLTPELLNRFRELAKDDKVVAIGEIGLDFYRNLSPRDAQIKAFETQLDLAVELGLPVILHVRKAFEDVFRILKSKNGLSGVFHCFSGGIEEAKLAVKMGFFVSFSGSLTYGSKKLEAALRAVPDNRLLFETDSPYLAPIPKRGHRNEPAYVKYIVEFAAKLLQKDAYALAESAFFNGLSLFRLEDKAHGGQGVYQKLHRGIS